MRARWETRALGTQTLICVATENEKRTWVCRFFVDIQNGPVVQV